MKSRAQFVFLTALAAFGIAFFQAPNAFAHKPSDAYLAVDASSKDVHGRWDIALRDLDYAIGLDTDGDGNVTWGELRSRQDAIAEYALPRIHVSADGEACELHAVGEQRVVDHSDGTYDVLTFDAHCSHVPKIIAFDYSLFFEGDPQHRGLLRLTARGMTRAAAFSDGERHLELDTSDMSAWRPFFAMVKQGIFHIGQGYDHLLFLIALLLTAVLRREEDHWEPALRFRFALTDVAKIVTAFTVAHSITLSLAATRIVSLPSRFVESAIAASVIVAAVNNLRRFLGKDRWVAAFALGLLHGFGFSSTLLDLGLPKDGLMVSLFGFNVGVELGQLAVVAVFLPIAFALRKTVFYRRFVLNVGSIVIATIALVWLTERAFAITIFARIF